MNCILRRIILLLYFLYGINYCVFANNIRITKEIRVVGVHMGIATLEFNLAWDNSWRDDFNWDAAWVFLKYKEVSGQEKQDWQPLFPEESGLITDPDYVCMPGKSENQCTGVLLFRAKNGNGQNKLKCRIDWKLPVAYKDFTQADFENNRILFLLQGIEMVFIPYKPSKLGDGESRNCFGDTLRNPLTVDDEHEQEVTYWLDDLGTMRNVTLGEAYPKGHKGFYLMKYELSQEQYVRFLNALSRREQEALLPHIIERNERSYVFGNPLISSCRNGVYLVRKPENGGAMHFECNLKDDGRYGHVNDGQTIACNYMSPADMLAYCAWAGLRPMSELEYEKAAHRIFPQEPEPGEYAWNNTIQPVFAQRINNSGMTTESLDENSNVNAGAMLDGPVRCGAFARVGSSQQSAGGSYWGIMELSGNLKELCYNVNACAVFDGKINGKGSFSLSLWPTEKIYFGTRGGGFTSQRERLRISDRAEANLYMDKDFFYRDSTVSFRGVKEVESGNVYPGKIQSGNGNLVCCGDQVHIMNIEEAKVEGVEDTQKEYFWYVNDSLIEGEGSMTLDYRLSSEDKGPVDYVFRRRAITPVGEANVSLTVRTKSAHFNLNSLSVSIDECDGVIPAIATAVQPESNLVYKWYWQEHELHQGALFAPERTDFNGQTGVFPIKCVAYVNGCSTQSQKSLEVEVQTRVFCCQQDSLVDKRDGQSYPTVKVGNACWMAKNLNYGTFQTANIDYWKFDEPGVQKWCFNNNSDNCAAYGGLYEWWEAVCGGMCNTDLTSANAQNLDLSAEADLVNYGVVLVNGKVKGICPDGWHLPSTAEWPERSVVLSDEWNIQRAGYRESDGGNLVNNGRGSWWTSTPATTSENSVFSRVSSSMIYATERYAFFIRRRSMGRSIRCVKD